MFTSAQRSLFVFITEFVKVYVRRLTDLAWEPNQSTAQIIWNHCKWCFVESLWDTEAVKLNRLWERKRELMDLCGKIATSLGFSTASTSFAQTPKHKFDSKNQIFRLSRLKKQNKIKHEHVQLLLIWAIILLLAWWCILALCNFATGKHPRFTQRLWKYFQNFSLNWCIFSIWNCTLCLCVSTFIHPKKEKHCMRLN